MRRFMYKLILPSAFLLAVAGPALSADIDVMTQNQYVGTDLSALVGAVDFNAAVVAALQTRAATRPADRAKAIAGLIRKRAPSLVGLQEVYNFTCYDSDPTDRRGCEDQSIAGAFTDQLADTLGALARRYVKAAEVVNMNLPAGLNLPPPLDGLSGIPVVLADGTPIFIGVVDRDVILARAGVAYEKIDAADLCDSQFRSVDGCNYQVAASTLITLPIPESSYTITREVRFERGFVGVNAVVDRKPYRFVTTHLETRLESFGPPGRYYQTAQAAELHQRLEDLQSTDPSPMTLVVGDFNSDPRDTEETPGWTPPYRVFSQDYTDVWTLRPGAVTAKCAPLVGYTCCQDEDLTNHHSALYERIDMIFSLAPPRQVKDARLFGDSVADQIGPPRLRLWLSDHAGVAARLQFGRPAPWSW